MEGECEIGWTLFSQDNVTVETLKRFETFRASYQPYHGYICLNICVLGVITNVINIIVLTKPRMRSSINIMLTAIAVCDMGTMLSYMIYLLHFVVLLQECDPSSYSYSWMNWLIVHMLLSIVLHTSSLWLSVLMAFVRTWTLRKNRATGTAWLRTDHIWKLSAAVYAIVFLFSIPNLIGQNVIEATKNFNDTCVDQIADGFEYYMIGRPSCDAYKVGLWINGILFKMVPCALLAHLSFSLLFIIRDANRRKKRLFNLANRPQVTSTNVTSSTSEVPLISGTKLSKLCRFLNQRADSRNAGNGLTNARQIYAKKVRRDRTTPMLLVILFVFLFTELPQGVIAVLSGLFLRDVQKYIYQNLGDVLDLLSLINSSVNFFLYCTMSAKYRRTFWQSILPSSVYQRIRPHSTTQRPNTGGATTLPGRMDGTSNSGLQETTTILNNKVSQTALRKSANDTTNGRRC